MELDELDVPEPGPGAQRRRHPVAGRNRRIGRHRVDLSDPAGRQDHGACVHRADAAAGALAEHVQGDTGDGRRLVGADFGRNQIEDEGVLDDLDSRIGGDARDQRPLDLRARGIPAGVGDAVAVVAALAGQLEGTAGISVEFRTARDQLRDLLGAFADEHPDRLLDAQAGAGGQGVVDVLLDGVPSACTEAMPPWAQLVEPAATTSLVTTTTVHRSLHSSAAVSPAIPEPRTTTSTSRTQPGVSAASRCGRTGNCGSRGIAGAALFSWDATSGTMGPCSPTFGPWFDAWVEYAYGAEGFWRHNRPDEHFRTAASSTGLIADLVSGLVAARPDITRVVDVGAGDGRLLVQVADRCADGRLRDLGCAESIFDPGPRSCRSASTGRRTSGTSGTGAGPVGKPTPCWLRTDR